MTQQTLMTIPVKEETYTLYMSRYFDMKKANPKATHDILMKELLGVSHF